MNTLDPGQYKVKEASLEGLIFQRLRQAYYPQLQRIGRELAKLDALPVMEEPPNSGKRVTTGNYSMRAPADLGGFLITGSGVNKRMRFNEVFSLEKFPSKFEATHKLQRWRIF